MKTCGGTDMRPIPLKLRARIAADPWMKTCVRRGPDCDGRITWEHCLLYGGKRINEPFAIIPLCCRHHLGDKLDKQFNQWVALRRATDADLDKYSKANFRQLLSHLNAKYEQS